ncbi:unnamed protein product, partial [Urochloa humidicola]
AAGAEPRPALGGSGAAATRRRGGSGAPASVGGPRRRSHGRREAPLRPRPWPEAGEVLSNMNHPAGDCPLCLYHLVGEDKDGSELPFTKLMSCYHCFHSDCIMRWWEWLQHGDANPKEHNAGGKNYIVNQHKGFCPVCRKVFDENDVEYVRDLLGESTSRLASLALDLGEDEKELLHSEAEQIRRKRIESLLKLQQERNGLIEPKKDLAIQLGMYVTLPRSTSDTAAEDSTDPSEDTTTSTAGTEQRSQANNTSNNKPKNSGYRRRNRSNASKRKGADTSHQ